MTINEVMLQVYPKVVQIAAEYPEIYDARPHLREIAWEHNTLLVRLVSWYMELRPDQVRECPDCHDIVPVRDFAATKCQDCALADYQGDQA